jgi:protein arginine N-methyltransferase 1
MSDIINTAHEIVKVNGFSSVITLVRGKMHEAVLPVEKVDIIISEWMGYFLLFEWMLPDVLFARDKYLKSDGHILPDKAEIWLAASQCSVKEDMGM